MRAQDAPADLLRILAELCDAGEPLTVQLDRRGFRVCLTVEPLDRAAVNVPSSPASNPAGSAAPPALPQTVEAAADPLITEWARGPEPKHMPDFSIVYWPGLGVFRFGGRKQRTIVRALWNARERGLPGVRQDELLRAADSESGRVWDLFTNSPAWKTLIVSAGPGVLSLPPTPSLEAEGGAP